MRDSPNLDLLRTLAVLFVVASHLPGVVGRTAFDFRSAWTDRAQVLGEGVLANLSGMQTARLKENVMSRATSRILVCVAVVAGVLVAAYWYWSPYWEIRQMMQAARSGDADQFNDHVDYPRLRESLKGQFAAKMAEGMGKVDKENPFAGLGAVIGMGMANVLVESMVRPEVVMQAFRHGTMDPSQGNAPSGAGQPAPGRPQDKPDGEAKREPRWQVERRGADKVVSYMEDSQHPSAPKSERLAVVFERTGFANWKLTELRLPNQM